MDPRRVREFSSGAMRKESLHVDLEYEGEIFNPESAEEDTELDEDE